MNYPIEKQKLLDLLQKLSEAVEDILLTGLTAASASTQETLHQAFKEASGIKLLRLGSTLRVASEEIRKFLANDDSFSAKRLSFFLNRSWMLSRGMIHAITTDNQEQWQALAWSPQGQRVAELEVVTLGVSKRVVPGAFCAFEFRLRLVQETADLPGNTPLIWSAVFPMRPGVDIPPEAFLQLPQKQKFKASDFLAQKIIHIENALVVPNAPVPRLTLIENSKVSRESSFTEWEQFSSWDIKSALARLQNYSPGPFDLDIELQEEIILRDWTIGEPITKDSERILVYPIHSGGLQFSAQVPLSTDTVLQKSMDKLRKNKNNPPLFGLMHYEMCRLVLQPLAVLDDNGPKQLGLSEDKIDAATLVKSLKF